MLRFLLLGLLVLLITAAGAQPSVTVQGRVLDAQTRRPVAYALVGVAGNQLGTSANEEGRFSLSIPPEYQPTALEITFIGYRKATLPLPVPAGQEVRILLEPAPTQLANVTVSGSALGIVQAAVARIPRNFATRPVQLTGFYRESSNVPEGRYLYLAEGVLRVRKESYRTARPTGGDVELVQTRKYEARDTSRTHLNWQAGPLIPHRFDFVYNRADFISKAHYAEYDYQIADVTTYNGRPVYAISFQPRSAKANYQGQVFIDLDTYAFLGADFCLTPAGVKRHQAGFAGMGEYAYSRRTRQVSYQRYAGRWYLKRVWDQAVSQQPGREYQHTSEFITTAIDTAKTRRPAYADRFRPEDVFLRSAVAYDSTFWQNFTTLMLPRQVEQQLLDEERQRRAAQLFSDSAATAAAQPVVPDTAAPAPLPPTPARSKSFLERLSYSSSVQLVPLRVSEGSLQVAYAPAGSTFAADTRTTTNPRQVGMALRFDYLFWLSPHWQLHYGAGGLRGTLRGGLQTVGLHYLRNLSRQRRPVYMRAGLDYSRVVLRQRLGRFHNPDAGLQVEGTALNASRLALGLQSITKGLAPQLGLEIKLSGSLYLFTEASYRFFPSTRSELLVEEKKGFFLSRNSARVPLSSPEVQVRLNEQVRQSAPFSPRPLLLRVGIAVGGH